MPGGGSHYAEDSCLKYHSETKQNKQINHVNLDDHHDVEKSGITSLNRPASAPADTVVEKNDSSLNGKESSGETQVPDSDASTLTLNEDVDSFPEGGLKGWSVVAGSFCGLFSVFGIINCTAILLDYFSAHQLKDYNASQIGWIFGVSLFLTFFCGAPIGPIFDAYGPRALILCGSILLVASMFLLGLCTRK